MMLPMLKTDWPRGDILCTRHELPFDAYSVTYSWQGGPVVEVTDRVAMNENVGSANRADARTMWIGPYRLLVVEFDPCRLTWLCVRWTPLGFLLAGLYHATRWLDMAYRRLILTAYVWGLAQRHEYVYPSWRDVYALRWAANRFGEIESTLRKLLRRSAA